MQRHFYRIACVLSLAPFLLTAQSSQPDDSFDRTSDDIDRFVDELVGDIEVRLDDFLDGRTSRSRGGDGYRWDDQEKEGTETLTFNGDTDVAEGDTVNGDLVVKNGTLTVRGTVLGDVLVVNGDVLLRPTARVHGNVRAMNGSVSRDDGSYVEGYTEESSKEYDTKRKRTSRARYSTSFKPFMWFDRDDDDFLLRYNRVEGLFIGFGENKKYFWDGSRSLTGHGSFGYGLASHKWRLQLGLDRQFATSSGLYEIGGEAHSLTDTKDEWIMSVGENTAAALFFREDYRDYHQREGYSVHTARYTKEGDVTTLLDLRYTVDRYTSMARIVGGSFFGGTTFRDNPAVDEGMLRSVSLTAGVSTVEKYRKRSEGWDLYMKAEYAGRAAGGDHDFSQVLTDIRRYQPLSGDDQFSIRLRAGSLEGTPVQQRVFELGGANTMPAYAFKEFAGNRMLLANIEYQVDSDILDEIFFWPDFLAMVLFSDAGAVASVPQRYGMHEGFDAFSVSSIRSDAGFAISWHNGDARLGFAWKTDTKSPAAVFFRLNRPF